MIINASETGLIDCFGLKMWSKKADEKIRSSFDQKKASVSLELSPELISLGISEAQLY